MHLERRREHAVPRLASIESVLTSGQLGDVGSSGSSVVELGSAGLVLLCPSHVSGLGLGDVLEVVGR